MKTHSGRAHVEYQTIVLDFADTDFTDADATQTYNLCKPSLPGGDSDWLLLAATSETTTAFTFSDGTAINLSVGIAGFAASIIADADITSLATELTMVNGAPQLLKAADTVQAVLTVSGGSSPLMTEITAGAVAIHLAWALTPKAIVSNIAQP